MPYPSSKDSKLSPDRHRLPAVDAMRGLVMILMTVDHASYAFNADRYAVDAAAWYTPGSVIPATQFLVRWMTHLCAPTFVFLAGMVLAFSIARKHAGGVSEKRIDADLLIRGLFILALDPLWMRWGFGGPPVFQVMYAIGGGICCMVLLRRLGTRSLLVAGVLLMLGSEAVAGLALWANDGQSPGPIGALLATGGRLAPIGFVLYPLLPWLAYMVLGAACGRLMQRGVVHHPIRWFAMIGIILLAFFLIIRGLNGYGNMLLYRGDMSLLQWLHVSKYPPSLSFALMTLSMMCLGLALLYRIYSTADAFGADPLLVFGRTPLFFYLLHVHLLSGGAAVLGLWKSGGLTEAFLATMVVLAVLYPLCRWYARLKRAHPKSILRFV